MNVTGCSMLALLGGLMLLSGCQRASLAEKVHPARIDSTEVRGIMKVTLEPRAAERIGLETTTLGEEQVALESGGTGMRKVVPYSALMYDTKGETWTFTSPQPLVYVRQKVVVESIEGDRVILAEGPAVGTVVVTVGAAELMGAEHKYGH